MHEDFAFEDRRKTSIGFLNADQYVESVAVLGEESQTFANETVYLVTQQPWGGVDVARVAGTTKDGAPFENLFVRCIATDGSKIKVIAIFEPEEVDRAVARLEELRPRGIAVACRISPPRPRRSVGDAPLAHDVEALMALTTDLGDLRRPASLTHVVGGRDALEESITQILEFDGRR